MRNSVPMFSLRTRLAPASFRRDASGTPLPPCRTSGFVVAASMAASAAKSMSLVRVWLRCTLPMEMATASTPLPRSNARASSGGVDCEAAPST